jgi:2-(1,2-epoxy-1,2-dihydrophenyl)acetyl-CoA isomerase
MAYSTIELERDGDVAIIRLNDPATLNAVTLKTIEEIGAALDEISGSARAMVLTGAGRAFCSGANLTGGIDRKSTRLNSSHRLTSRMPSSA